LYKIYKKKLAYSFFSIAYKIPYILDVIVFAAAFLFFINSIIESIVLPKAAKKAMVMSDYAGVIFNSVALFVLVAQNLPAITAVVIGIKKQVLFLKIENFKLYKIYSDFLLFHSFRIIFKLWLKC
jgi:hypothetical protein